MTNKIILIFALIFLNSCKKDPEIDINTISGNTELPGVKVDFFKKTPVFELANAIKNEDLIKIYAILKKRKFDIDYKDNNYGYTVLMYATIYKKNNIIKILLENGANPNIKSNKDKLSAFFFAVKNTNKIGHECDTKILTLMTQYGANVNTHYEESKTLANHIIISENHILNIACTKGCLNVVKFLVNKGADINYYNEKYGNSAILQALYQDNLDIAKYLIIEKKAKIPEILFIRPAEETNSGKDEKVTLKAFLNEQDYSDSSSNDNLKKEILSYLEQHP